MRKSNLPGGGEQRQRLQPANNHQPHPIGQKPVRKIQPKQSNPQNGKK
jgi:hypothetical protein